MGGTGLEPVAFAMSTQRANQTAPTAQSAGEGSWTLTTLRSRDFKSRASASSATPAKFFIVILKAWTGLEPVNSCFVPTPIFIFTVGIPTVTRNDTSGQTTLILLEARTGVAPV